MIKPRKLQHLFLGTSIIASEAEYKRLMLTGYVAVISMIVAIIYTLIDLFHKVYHAFPAYAILFIMPIISIRLLHLRKYKAGKILLLMSMNLVIFWSALTDPFETGVFMFFIPAGIGSFVILPFSDNKTGIALACFTTFLFMIAYFSGLKPVAVPQLSALYINISFVFNYFISLTISILAVRFLMHLYRQSEEELIRKENFAQQKNAELQKVNEELDRFVYSVSHDLRSPLSSILGLTRLATLTADRDELNQILHMIQGRVNAQDHFIREIIDYSRNARTQTLAEAVNLESLVMEVVASLKFDKNADKIEFKQNLRSDDVIVSDTIRLKIILSNLIGNAIKYHDLTKENPFIEIGYDSAQQILYVRDNGIGIGAEYQDKIFNMFYRGSDRSSGSGLGLFITKEAVTKLGGTIKVESVYGAGTTFFVYFPATSNR